MSIEKNFDVAFVAEQALREKQIQQNYRPVIALHKWFARRPGTLFRALVLAEFGNRPLRQSFFLENSFSGKRIVDPFMGGGTPLLEANRLGCAVEGCDINPMAAWIVKEAIEDLNLSSYRTQASNLISLLSKDLKEFYVTDCPIYGDKAIPVKYFIWVKEVDCDECGHAVPLYPGFLLAQDVRHPSNVLLCSACGALSEVAKTSNAGRCKTCGVGLTVEGPASRGVCRCGHCGHPNRYPGLRKNPPRHRLVAIEYYNPHRRLVHRGRFFKSPDMADIERYEAAGCLTASLRPRFVPEDSIPVGDETRRLHKWGYSHYRELFNPRQILGMELSARLISNVEDPRVRSALATNLSDLLRYQNMLCRYDTMALKSLDVFSVHGFPVGLVQCESNLFGIVNDEGALVGSGGWRNIVDKYARAKAYCEAPFETRRSKGTSERIFIRGEWIGRSRRGEADREVSTRCASSTTLEIPQSSVDGVFTDPPYFGNVQYSELMDFCYVWLRLLVGETADGFNRASTRSPEELTGNETCGRGISHFAQGLSRVYCSMSRALKPGAPLVFTYHHNKLEAYQSVGVAILDAGLTCSASIPCPAEMGGSIHIHGTSSSIIDTIFVCRSSGSIAQRSLVTRPAELVDLVLGDLEQLHLAGVVPSRGDVRCIVFGHVTRIGVWNLRTRWETGIPISQKLSRFGQQIAVLGNLDVVIDETKSRFDISHPRKSRKLAATSTEGAENALSI